MTRPLCLALLLLSLLVAPLAQAFLPLQRSMSDVQYGGSSLYSTSDYAHDALEDSFVDGKFVRTPSASFCSGAVYLALIHALELWDKDSHRISKESWDALRPRRCKDGEGIWGRANANGPGFAVLIEELRAGYSFTDPARAQRDDFVKIWWTKEIGVRERGHLGILLRQDTNTMTIWSSNEGRGIGELVVPKKKIARILFTRVTTPKAFIEAAQLVKRRPINSWLNGLLRVPGTWDQCRVYAQVR